MKEVALPISKKDVRYDATKGEVTLRRDKFDELVGFVTETLGQLEEAEHSRSVAESRLRQTKAEGELLQVYLDTMIQARRQVERWLEKNSVQELSRRTGIPYATCHRIVNGQLEKGTVDPQNFARILGATGRVRASQSGHRSAQADVGY